MSWKPEVCVEGNWARNGLVFATEKEARDSAYDLMLRWTLVEDYRAVEVTDLVNSSYHDGELKEISING